MNAISTKIATWWTIFCISFEERLVYRIDFAVATLMRFIPILTQIFLWTAIFTAAGRQDIAGYSQKTIIAYYLLVLVGRALSSMPNLASGMVEQIRNGEIKKFLIQPVDLIGFLLLTRVAHKLVYYGVAIAPFALVFFLCREFFPDGWPDAPIMAAYIAALIMAFLMGFFLEAAIGMIGFWFLEVSSLLFIYMMLNYLLSGHMFPLDMLPFSVRGAFDLLPFQYLAYFPTAVFLGKVEGIALVQGLWIQLAWVVVSFGLCKVVYHYGVKHYSGFGG